MKASTLTQLLGQIFETEFVSRGEWANALGVSKAAISQWARGRTVPGPDHLDAMRVLVSQDDRLPENLRERFEAVLDQPIHKVVDSPRRSMGPTLRHYLVRPRQQAAMTLLATLPPREQIDLLIDLGKRIHQRLSDLVSRSPRLERVPQVHDPARLDQPTEQAQHQKLTVSRAPGLKRVREIHNLARLDKFAEQTRRQKLTLPIVA